MNLVMRILLLRHFILKMSTEAKDEKVAKENMEMLTPQEPLHAPNENSVLISEGGKKIIFLTLFLFMYFINEVSFLHVGI